MIRLDILIILIIRAQLKNKWLFGCNALCLALIYLKKGKSIESKQRFITFRKFSHILFRKKVKISLIFLNSFNISD